jgi:mannose-6-phosphate isomerase-like protein (cupin superfamily)
MATETLTDKRYDIQLGDKFGALRRIDIPAEAALHQPWFNETLTTVNDSLVRLGVLQGEFHWHRHEEQDEFFLVLDGTLLLDVEGHGTITLERHCGYTVPKGVLHRTRAPQRTEVLMIEQKDVVPTGD